MWTLLAILFSFEKEDLGPTDWKTRQYLEKIKKEEIEKRKLRILKIKRFFRITT